MTKIDLAIKALADLPEDRREEVAELVLDLTAAIRSLPGESALGAEQREEVRRRRSSGFVPGDADRIDQLLARLA